MDAHISRQLASLASHPDFTALEKFLDLIETEAVDAMMRDDFDAPSPDILVERLRQARALKQRLRNEIARGRKAHNGTGKRR